MTARMSLLCQSRAEKSTRWQYLRGSQVGNLGQAQSDSLSEGHIPGTGGGAWGRGGGEPPTAQVPQPGGSQDPERREPGLPGDSAHVPSDVVATSVANRRSSWSWGGNGVFPRFSWAPPVRYFIGISVVSIFSFERGKRAANLKFPWV